MGRDSAPAVLGVVCFNDVINGQRRPRNAANKGRHHNMTPPSIKASQPSHTTRAELISGMRRRSDLWPHTITLQLPAQRRKQNFR